VNRIPVPTLDLTSNGLAGHKDRVDGWHGVQSPLFSADLAPDRQSTLDWRFRLHHLGVGVCGQTRSSDQTIRRTKSAIAIGDCDHIFVDHLVDCDMAGEAGGQSFAAQSGDVLLFDMARPATFGISAPDHRRGGWRTAFLMIPRAHFETVCDVRNLHGLVLREGSAVGQIVRSHIRALAAAAAALDGQEAEALGRGTAALMAQALAPASYRDPRDRERFTDVTMLRVRHFIAGNLGRADLSPNLIARECGISRATLYRLFEPFGGVAGHVRRQRLLRAKRELGAASQSNQTISAIARRNGFTDDASFRRAFRQAFGLSASDVRAHLDTPGAVPSASTIGQWVRDL